MQLAFDSNSHLVYRDWSEIVRATIPFFWVRLGAGLIYLAGMVLCAINVFQTICHGKPVQDETVQAPPLIRDTEYVAQIDAALSKSGWRDFSTSMHSLVERWPAVMILFAAGALAIGGLCEIVPNMIQGALSPKIASVTPYTPLELTGRDIYIREGCSNCHTQMIRTLRAETERYGGQYTRPGEGIYDRPFLWGSKRTGPDLGREGVLRPSAAWHYYHLQRPSSMSTVTVMPNYPWLISDDMDLSDIGTKLAVLAGMPMFTPYKAADIEQAESNARAQALVVANELRKEPRLKDDKDLEKKEIVAVIAYLQRLGTDLGKPSPATVSTAGH